MVFDTIIKGARVVTSAGVTSCDIGLCDGKIASLATELSEANEIIDARGAARFTGEAAEPRPGMRAGHIPGSRNVPFGEVLNPDQTMKDEAGIRAAMKAAGVDLTKPAITTCGSGVTAAILCLALERIGKTDHALYDGSWSEWGMYDDLPIATGAA